MQVKQHLLDKRVVKRALQEGLLDKALYQKTLDELPDLSHRIQTAQDAGSADDGAQHDGLQPSGPQHDAASSGTTASY